MGPWVRFLVQAKHPARWFELVLVTVIGERDYVPWTHQARLRLGVVTGPDPEAIANDTDTRNRHGTGSDHRVEKT